MKTKFLISEKALRFSLLFGLVCSVFISMAQFNAACDQLRSNVLRLHIIANSDSDEDQALKLKIRDEILKNSGGIFENADNVESAITLAEGSLKEFEEIANRVAAENGFGYKARAKLGDSYFETREYEDFTLPAGNYQSLIITLGEGGGKNWWCVIYPEVCIPAAAQNASLSDSVADEGVRIAEEPQRYVMRFKTVEIYENIKKFFKN